MFHAFLTDLSVFPPTYWKCTAKGLKPLILFKDEVKEMDTLFEAQLKTNDIQFKEKNLNG